MAEMMEGYKHEDFDSRYGSKGVTGASLGLGIAGTTLGLLNGGLGLMTGLGAGRIGAGMYGGMYGMPCRNEVEYVSKATFDLEKENTQLRSQLSLVQAEQDSEVKMATVYEKLAKQLIDQERLQNAKWTEQLVWNARQDARIAVLEHKVYELDGMSARYIRADRVSPEPMPRYNQWVAPTNATQPAA